MRPRCSQGSYQEESHSIIYGGSRLSLLRDVRVVSSSMYCFASYVGCLFPSPSLPSSLAIFIYDCVVSVCRIAVVTKQSRNLMTNIGDVGDEYRG